MIANTLIKSFKKSKEFFICIALLFSMLLVALAANQIFLYGINADFLYDIEAPNNLIHFKTFLGQGFPRAPCFFPDLFVFFILELFIDNNIALLHFNYLIVFLLAYAVIVYNLLRTSGLQPKFALISLTIAFPAFFFVIPNQNFLIEFKGSHLSSLLFGLVFLQFYITRYQSGITLKYFLIYLFFTLLVFISDNIIAMQLMAPLGVVVLFDLLTKKAKYKTSFSIFFIFFICILVSIYFPLLLQKYVHATMVKGNLFKIKHYQELGTRFLHFSNLAITHVRMFPLFYTMLIFYNVSILFFIRLLFKNKQPHSYDCLVRIIAFLYLSQFCSIFMTVLVDRIHDILEFRYFSPIYFSAPLIMAMLIGHLLQNKIYLKFIYVFNVFLIAGCIFLFFHYYYQTLKNIHFSQPYPEYVACMDDLSRKYSLTNGVAEYWYVRPLRMLSKQSLHVSQINDKLKFYNLIDNTHYQYEDWNTKRPFKYNFLISNRLPKEKIIASVGYPDHIQTCDKMEVWVYASKDSASRLNNFLSTRLI